MARRSVLRSNPICRRDIGETWLRVAASPPRESGARRNGAAGLLPLELSSALRATLPPLDHRAVRGAVRSVSAIPALEVGLGNTDAAVDAWTRCWGGSGDHFYRPCASSCLTASVVRTRRAQPAS